MNCNSLLTGLGRFAYLLLVLGFLTSSTHAAVHYVDATSTNASPPYTSWATAARDIQSGIDASIDGDTVLVTNGVYASAGGVLAAGASNRVAITKPVQVASVNGPGQTFILGDQGTNPVRCAYVTNGGLLSGFTLTIAVIGQNGGGIYAEPSGVVSNCVVWGTSGFSGGGIFGGKVYNSTITACTGLNGGGLSSCTAFGCTISTNTALSNGGGLTSSSATNCTITGNHALNAGGAIISSLDHCTIAANVAAGSGGGADFNCQLWNCVVIGNTVTATNGRGGGLSLTTATGCLIISNSTPGQGGGTYYGSFTNCVLAWNICSNSGAGAFSGVLEGCTLSNNYAYGPGGGSLGSTLSHCTIQANTAMAGGGGACSATLWSSVVASNYSDSTGGGLQGCNATDCSIIGNRGTDGGGVWGGSFTNCLLAYNRGERVYYPRGGAANSALLDHCTVATNSASEGAGVRSSYVYNSVLIGNIGSWGGGAAYSTLDHCALGANVGYPAGAGSCSLTGCLVTNNVGLGVLGGSANGSTVAGNVEGAEGGNFINSVVYGNSESNWEFDSFYGLNFTASCTTPLPTNYFTGWPAFTSMSAVDTFTNDPLFINPAAGDYHLQPSSPCINSGRNSSVTSTADFDGLPRIKGGTVDIGAYEFQNPTSIISYAWLQQYGLPTDGSSDFTDLDGDGMNNWQEWRAGTSPADSTSVLRLLSPLLSGQNPASVNITWQSVTNRNYLLQRSTNLTDFVTLATSIPGLQGVTSYTDTNATGTGPFFYRVGVR
jgi:hypothetical protein